MNRTRRPLAVSAAVATAAATAIVSAPAAHASTQVGQASIPITHVYITKHDHIRMPTHLRAGMREFVVNAATHSSFQLAMPRPGYTKRMAVRDISAGLIGRSTDVKALRRLENHLRFLGGVNAGPRHMNQMWRTMHTGKVWAVETTDQPAANKILTVHVTGTALPTVPLVASGHVRAVGMTRWAKMPRSIPSSGVLEFQNHSTDNHVMVMIKLAKGKTMRDFRHWVNSGLQGPPPLGKAQFSFGTLSPNSQMAATYSQPRGKYVLLCFWPDADHGGEPHFLMGMYRGITLT
jgi:hypothetical protein